VCGASVGEAGHPVEGYWLPKEVRASLLSTNMEWETLSFVAGSERGRECDADARNVVTARWPRLSTEDWKVLLEALSSGRDRAPQGAEFWDRLQRALTLAGRRLADPSGSARATIFDALPGYTGYSPAMVASILAAPDMWDVQQLRPALAFSPTHAATARWEPLPGLPGLLRFFPSGKQPGAGGSRAGIHPWELLLGKTRRLSPRPLFAQRSPPGFVVGYGAGNVPGTALIMVLLSLATTLAGGRPPVVVIRNSRREPIFSPLVLGAIEEVDPDLLASVAILVWDYDDGELQRRLFSQTDLVIAAAGDDTIDRLATQIAATPSGVAARFHAHGHKVSFSAISREMFETPATEASSETLGSGEDLLDVVALLAALDSSFWDQNGCVSSRVHFVEKAFSGDPGPREYGLRLAKQMRLLAGRLPRGAWPRRHLHDTFDRYKALEGDGGPGAGLTVLSSYHDDFVVILDERDPGRPRPQRSGFIDLVNSCRGRVVAVRPVEDLMEIPGVYLRLLPPASLQSLSVAVGRPGQPLTPRFLDFAAACGERGITAIRVVGRGAFPQLAYSWDGFLPLDLVSARPPGHFTTIEFDDPYTALMRTYANSTATLVKRAQGGL